MASLRRSIGIVTCVYALTTLSMATIGVLVPFMDVLAAHFHATASAIGLAIALFSAPSAILATLGGRAIDALGLRRSLLISGSLAVVADGLADIAPSMFVFQCALTLAGIAFAGISVAAPALLIAEMGGTTRLRAMSFWSTYAPTGYAMGLLLAALFTSAGGWRPALGLHALFTGLSTLAGLRLPAPRRPSNSVTADAIVGRGARFAVFQNPRLMRLGLAVAVPNGISYGTSLIAPAYLARVHGLSIAAASTTVALAKIIAMLIGGAMTGHLLARRVNVRVLFTCMAALGLVAQVVLYRPGSSFTAATLALVLWLFAFGGMSGAGMAHLPALITQPRDSGTAAGLIGQIISVISFAAPAVYFSVHTWTSYITFAVGGLLISIIVLPAQWRSDGIYRPSRAADGPAPVNRV